MLGVLLRRRRLQWYGHVKKRGEGEPLREIMDLAVGGMRPP